MNRGGKERGAGDDATGRKAGGFHVKSRHIRKPSFGPCSRWIRKDFRGCPAFNVTEAERIARSGFTMTAGCQWRPKQRLFTLLLFFFSLLAGRRLAEQGKLLPFRQTEAWEGFAGYKGLAGVMQNQREYTWAPTLNRWPAQRGHLYRCRPQRSSNFTGSLLWFIARSDRRVKALPTLHHVHAARCKVVLRLEIHLPVRGKAILLTEKTRNIGLQPPTTCHMLFAWNFQWTMFRIRDNCWPHRWQWPEQVQILFSSFLFGIRKFRIQFEFTSKLFCRGTMIMNDYTVCKVNTLTATTTAFARLQQF